MARYKKPISLSEELLKRGTYVLKKSMAETLSYKAAKLEEDNWWLRTRLNKLANGLISIAEIAMPDSFLESDGRVRLARSTLAGVRTKKKS